MGYILCKKCGMIGDSEMHRCLPEWTVYHHGDESFPAFADTPEDAAENYVEMYYDYLDHPAEVELIVNRQGSNKKFKIVVIVDFCPEFTAFRREGDK